MKTTKPILSLLLLGFLCIVPATASDLFTYQGKLTDETGLALSDGQYRIGVRIWDVATGGTEPLWARKYDVPVQNGVFSLMIGAEGLPWGIVGETGGPLTNSIKLAVSGTERFLEITVMSEADGPELDSAQWKVLQPRQRLNAVPYAMNGVPPGTVVPFAGTTAPEGWLICDGSTRDGSDPRFAALFYVIQDIYGDGDGSDGSFNLPNLMGRTVIGSGDGDGADPALTQRVTGETLGSEEHVLAVAELPDHQHGLDLPTEEGGAHRHRFTIGPGDGGSRNRAADGEGSTTMVNTTIDGEHSHQVVGDTQGDKRGSDLMRNEPFSIIQPSLVLNYIIKL